jgi:hypothetical protein
MGADLRDLSLFTKPDYTAPKSFLPCAMSEDFSNLPLNIHQDSFEIS